MDERTQAAMALTFAIEQQLYRFARLVDGKAFDDLGSVFADKSVGIYNGRHGHDTADALIAAMHRTLADGTLCGRTQHNILNVTLTTIADDAVESCAYFYAVQAGTGAYEGQFWKTWGEYNDVWDRTPAGWRIAKRLYTTFFSEGPQEIVGGNY